MINRWVWLFSLQGGCASDYCLVEVCSDVEGRVMRDDECPLWSTSSAHVGVSYVLYIRVNRHSTAAVHSEAAPWLRGHCDLLVGNPPGCALQ